MASSMRCGDRACMGVDVRLLLRLSRYCKMSMSAWCLLDVNILEASSSHARSTRQRKTSPSKLIRRVSCRSSSRSRVEVWAPRRGIEVRERAAEGLQYGEVIANEGGKRVRSSRSSLGQVWYLCAFDLVNLLASLLGLASSGGTPAAASGSGDSSTAEVRRSPKQTMHDSAMLVGCCNECNKIGEPQAHEFW